MSFLAIPDVGTHIVSLLIINEHAEKAFQSGAQLFRDNIDGIITGVAAAAIVGGLTAIAGCLPIQTAAFALAFEPRA